MANKHNNISGNEPYIFEFYEQMNEILGDRPVSQATTNSQIGFDSSMKILDVNRQHDSYENIVIELIEDAPYPDGAFPGSSKEKGFKLVGNSKASSAVYRTRSSKKKTNSELTDFLECCENRKKRSGNRERNVKQLFTAAANDSQGFCKEIFKETNNNYSDKISFLTIILWVDFYHSVSWVGLMKFITMKISNCLI